LNGWAVLQPYVLPLTWLGKGVKMMMVTIGQQEPNSQFIQNLNNSPDAGIPYHIVAGNTQMLPKEAMGDRSLFMKVVKTLRSRGHYSGADAYLGEANDMVVRTKSIGSAGQQRNVKVTEVPCDHFGYFVPMSDGLRALNNAITEGDVQGK
jgi:hypothetical protein